jgi:hypothetical protein
MLSDGEVTKTEKRMARKATTFTLTTPDGTILKFRSEKCFYTHAILEKYKGRWRVLSRVGRPELVAGRLQDFKWKGATEVVAVPVSPVVPQEREQQPEVVGNSIHYY